jgi:hypothetical protein
MTGQAQRAILRRAVAIAVASCAGTRGAAPDTHDGAPADGGALSSDAASATPVSCDSLSKVVGAWQDISPAAFYMPVNLETLAVAVNPKDETVFAAAGNVTNGSSCPPARLVPRWARVSTSPATAAPPGLE